MYSTFFDMLLDKTNQQYVYFQKVSATTFYIWIKPPRSKWIRYQMFNHIDAGINVNTWRIQVIAAVDIPETPISNPTAAAVTALTTSGSQFEYAISPLGAIDFMGGFHGDEQVQSIAFLIDGVPFVYGDLANNTVIRGNTFQMVQTSFLYDPDSPTTQLATMLCYWTFKHTELTLEWHCAWIVDDGISTSYALMMPALRGAGLTTWGNVNNTIYDITGAGPTSPGANVNSIIEGNTNNGLTIQIIVDDLSFFNGYAKTATKGMMLINTTNYNKIYCDRILQTASFETVSPGTIWNFKGRSIINYPN